MNGGAAEECFTHLNAPAGVKLFGGRSLESSEARGVKSFPNRGTGSLQRSLIHLIDVILHIHRGAGEGGRLLRVKPDAVEEGRGNLMDIVWIISLFQMRPDLIHRKVREAEELLSKWQNVRVEDGLLLPAELCLESIRMHNDGEPRG